MKEVIPVIYWTCGDCGLEFRKGKLKKPRCIKCGSTRIFEDDVPDCDLTLADEIADRLVREEYLKR